jgi:hypothetical protein
MHERAGSWSGATHLAQALNGASAAATTADDDDALVGAGPLGLARTRMLLDFGLIGAGHAALLRGDERHVGRHSDPTVLAVGRRLDRVLVKSVQTGSVLDVARLDVEAGAVLERLRRDRAERWPSAHRTG